MLNSPLVKRVFQPKTLSFLFLLIISVLIPFFSDIYVIHVINISLYYIAIASTWNLLAGITGLFSLAHAAFAGIGAYTTALLSRYFGLSPFLGMLMGGGLSAGISYSIGALTLKLRRVYLALATWAFAGSFRLIISIGYEYTRGDLGLPVEYLFGVPPGRSTFSYYYTLVSLTIVCLYTISKIINSKFGLFLRAIREDELAAETAGVDTVKYKKRVFAISGFLTGLFGAFYAHYIGVISPMLASVDEMVLIIIMTIIGGYGSFMGPIIGAPLIEGISELLRIYGEFRMVVYGVIVLILFRITRGGVWDAVQSLYNKFLHRRLKKGQDGVEYD